MNSTDKRRLYEFPAGLDAIVNAKFPGCKCTTGFSIVEMRHVTTWKNGHKKAAEIRAFVDGFAAGNRELAERLTEGKAQ